VTSDFKPEVEIRPFHACAMHPAIIIGTVRLLWTWLWDRYRVPQNVFLVSVATFPVMDRSGRVGSRLSWVGSGLEILTRVQLWCTELHLLRLRRPLTAPIDNAHSASTAPNDAPPWHGKFSDSAFHAQ